MVISTPEERVRQGDLPSSPSKAGGAGLPPGSSKSTSTSATGKRTGKPIRNRDSFAAIFFLAPSLGGFALFTLVPIVGSILISLTVWPVAGIAHWTGFDNFWNLFNKDTIFVQSIYNTVFFVATYVPMNIVLSLALAVWISPRIKGRNAYRFVLFIPVVAPMIANAAIWRIMLVPNGLFDSLSVQWFGHHAPNYLGLTSTAMWVIVIMSLWQGFGYNLMVFASALEQVPENLTEAAALDGAGAARQFFSIKLPMISPAVFFGTTMTIITSFQVFAQAYVMTGGGPSFSTQTMVMTLFQDGFAYHNLGYASAIGVVLFVGILAVSGIVFALQRKLVHYE
jgi:multiple sugar transport system permease protein